jgi:hypothetical protein
MNGCRLRRLRARGVGRVASATLPGLLCLACSEGLTTLPIDAPPENTVTQIEFVEGIDQEILGGRRSPDPIRVRAVDGLARPVPGAIVEFQLTGKGGGILSQPQALTDSAGVASTYLLEAKSGPAVLLARAGSAAAGLGLEVTRAPGTIVFEEASGAVGLPGKAHPDSVVRAQLLDTDGVPMSGVPVFFTGPPDLSRIVDTTDARGWASTVVRRAAISAGEGRVFAFVPGFPDATEFTRRPLEPAAKRVVLVSVDGLRADALERYDPPNLRRIATEGAVSTTARTVLPSLTAPAHLSLFSSVPPDEHGIFGDDIEYTEAMARLEPLFRVGVRRGLTTRAFVARSGPLETLETALQCKLAFGLDSLSLVEPDAEIIVGDALPTLMDAETRMVFVHIPDPDLAGHAYGWTSPEYGDAVLRADAAVGELLDALSAETLLLVVSDHGGGGAFGSHQHGSASDVDVLIPMLLWGPRVVPGSDVGAASILDVAPTLLWALGFAPPSGYEGRALTEVFR